MNKIEMKIRPLLLAIGLLMSAGDLDVATAQDQRWIRVGEAQSFFKDYGCEPELQDNNYLSWPAQYGDDQHTTRMKGLWLGARNFYDPVEQKTKTVKVIGAGPRFPANQFTMIFPQGIKLIGRYDHPTVVVDDQSASAIQLYDELDELDENLPCDRMIVSRFNTSMGVSVTRKILAFTQQNHDNYFIQDDVFKNTGIINAEGEIYEQTLQEFWIYFTYRYAFAGVTSLQFGSTWGSFGSQWGTSTLLHNFNMNSPEGIRGFYAWYGPTNSYDHPLTPAQDWGCPDYEETGTLGSAKYTGVVTLFASKSPQEFGTDDPNQPATTAYTGSDATPMETAVSQYNESFMQQRYNMMTEGRLDHSQSEAFFAAVGNDGYVDDWTVLNPYRNTGTTGSSSQGQGFGPYTLGPGDSLRIVFAEGASGISWEKGREVGAKWYAYFRDLPSKPALIMPDGSPATGQNDYGFSPHDAYKRAWCETGADSIMQTLRNAVANYNSGYQIPGPPPPPSSFTVQSGGNEIRLTWTNNATSHPHFGGYVIYRSEGTVKEWRTVYEQIFETNDPAVTSFDDVSARRGFDYYYYIQAKDDGTQVPGTTLYSSLFLTMTNVAAALGRPAMPETPVSPDIDAHWKLITAKGAWLRGSDYSAYDAVTYNSSSYVCTIPVAGDTITPNLGKAHWRLTRDKGEWVSGSAYTIYDVVSYNGLSYVAVFTIPRGKGLETVRIVPNPYDIRARFFQFGDQSQYDRIAFYGLPPQCTLKIFTERGDLIWEKEHASGLGAEFWNSTTSSGQIVASGVYILYVEAPGRGAVYRKFIIIR